MSVVDITTGELRPAYSEVKRSVEAARESGSKFFEQIVWQIENRAWEVLGHESWDAMREAEYGDMGVVVPRADRPEIVARLRRTGMTQADIAETVGVDQGTVSRDLNMQTHNDPPPTIINARGQERPASYSRQATKEELSAKYADQFPALAFFRERGQHERVNALGRDLAAMDATEQSERLEILDKTIAHEKRVESGESPSLDERVKARKSELAPAVPIRATTEPDDDGDLLWDFSIEVRDIEQAVRALSDENPHPTEVVSYLDRADLPAFERAVTYLSQVTAELRSAK